MLTNTKKNQVIIDLITDGDRPSTLRKSVTIDQANKMALEASKTRKEVAHGK